jgi:plastocyanin
MEAVSFQPADLKVRVGDSVVWVNKDPFPHTTTSEEFDSKVIPPRSRRTTPRTAGELPYVCILHPTMKEILPVIK